MLETTHCGLDNHSGGREQHIAFFLDHLRGGGLQKVILVVAGALAERGHPVELVVCEPQGPLRDQLPDRVKCTKLEPSSSWSARTSMLSANPKVLGVMLLPLLLTRRPSPTLPFFPALVRFLREQRPAVLFTATPYMNVEGLLARHLAGVSTRVVISEHNDLSSGHPLGSGWHGRYLQSLVRGTYDTADSLIAVSGGVAGDLARRASISRERIAVIYNPVVTPDLVEKTREPLDHAWFEPGNPPVVLGVGRLGKAKDFPNLLRAFTRLRAQRPARLMILGEARHPKKTAKRRAELMGLAAELGVAEDVALLGHVPNPFAYMAHASVFVLSSLYEGFGNVIAEALACGCPVVSTDCPSGPAEILDGGKFGTLVPVRNDAALAAAIASVLDSPPDPERLRQRARLFSVDRAVDRYEELLVGSR